MGLTELTKPGTPRRGIVYQHKATARLVVAKQQLRHHDSLNLLTGDRHFGGTPCAQQLCALQEGATSF